MGLEERRHETSILTEPPPNARQRSFGHECFGTNRTVKIGIFVAKVNVQCSGFVAFPAMSEGKAASFATYCTQLTLWSRLQLDVFGTLQ
jgi:hypothetical protein